MGDILGRDNCDHKRLRFGSGDYYVFCTDCITAWVKTKPGTDWVKTKPGTDQPDAFVNNHQLDGEDRVKEDESND
jgi:hypothetical protein